MTNTTNNDSGLNIDHLEALARAATPGEWKVERLHGGGHHNVGIRVRGPVVSGYAAALNTRWANDVQAAEQEANAAYIAAANPAAVLELIALARRAAPVSALVAATDDAFIEQAVRDAKVYGVMPNSANTIGVGRAVLAAERKRAALANQPAPTAAPEGK